MSSPSTPRTRRSARNADNVTSPRSEQGTPRSRRSARSKPAADEQSMMSPPPARRQKVEGSPVASSPASSRRGPVSNSLFSSPPGPVGTSEIDVSSPLHYGTPSSRAMGTPGGGATPRRRRLDIGGPQSRTLDVANEVPSSELGSEAAPTGPQMVIWGTDIEVEACKNKFKRFIRQFKVQGVDEDEVFDGLDISLPLYMEKLDQVNIDGEPFLNFNCAHLRSFDEALYQKLICYPQEVIPTFDIAVNDIFFEKYPDTVLEHTIQVRPYSAEKTKNMRALNPEDIDQLITITGMVIRSSNIIPEMREAFFQCSVCQHTRTVEIDRGRIAEPVLCENCQTNFSYSLVHNRCAFTDKQLIRLQEAPEDMPAGQTPHTVVLYAHNDLVDCVQPGDRVHVTGVYRAMPLRVNPRQRNIRAVYKTHIDVVHFRKTDARRLRDSADSEVPRLSEERLQTIKSLVRDKPDLYERLAAALAPSIYEHEDIKKGILLQLFGGTRKDFSAAGRGHCRSDLNILLCGDPGTSKSQLLQYVYNLMPRGQYTSGKGSSAVGLTAYVTKDPETRQLVLQTGALVLSDNGVCCIDEFDKMTDTTRSVLHEVMEQQTLSIAKAGIICQLNARTSILAAANPVESQWNKHKTIIDNIQLPHTLLSRFDLIFLLLDPQDETYDRRLATHLVSLYYKSPSEERQEHMDLSLLRDYISYARAYVQPKLTEDASQALIHAYVDMRKIGSGRGQVSAYPRQLESLIRLSEAHAKMRLSSSVEVADVEEARRLHREALKQSAVDPTTGRIDVSILTTGLSGAARKRRAELAQALRKLITSKGKVLSLKYQSLLDELKSQSDMMVTREMFDEALEQLREDDFLIMTGRVIRPQHVAQ